MQRNLFFVILSLSAAVGCGGSRPPAPSDAPANAPDPSIGTGADAGQPDAGPPASAPDAGTTPPDCSANAPFDARCFDPGTPSVAVTQSEAPQCAAFLPVNVPKPALFTRAFPGPGMGLWSCGAVPDGDGHLGVCMYSDPGYPADGTTTRVMTAGGDTLATLAGTVVRSGDHGFLTLHSAIDYGQAEALEGW